MKMLLTCVASCWLLTGAVFAATSPMKQQSAAPSPSQSHAASPAPQASATPSSPAARPEDVDSIEHILAAVYDVISGPPGKRNWDRFRSLYYPGAQLIPSGRNEKGEIRAHVDTPEGYATRAQSYFDKEGFFEKSIANRIEVWDHIAHVWSAYESRHTPQDSKPFARGINSFQLINDGHRWWILSIYWEGEDAAHPLPAKYLK
jgi:hypothetical protein